MLQYLEHIVSDSWTNAKVAIVDNPNAKEMMNHPAALTLEDMK